MATQSRCDSKTNLNDGAYATLLQHRPCLQEERRSYKSALVQAKPSFFNVASQDGARSRSASVTMPGAFGDNLHRSRSITLNTGEDDETLSPLSWLVNRTFQDGQGYAVIRNIPLRDVALPHADPDEDLVEQPLRRPQTSMASFPEVVRSHCTSSVRPLTYAGLSEKGMKASQLFHEVENVNRRARSKESVEAILADSRRHREESKHGYQVRPSTAPQDLVVKLDIDSSSSSAAPRRLSLMEQFGYGAKTITQEPERETVVRPELLPPTKTNFVSLGSKKNDLKERLAAAQRRTIE